MSRSCGARPPGRGPPCTSSVGAWASRTVTPARASRSPRAPSRRDPDDDRRRFDGGEERVIGQLGEKRLGGDADDLLQGQRRVYEEPACVTCPDPRRPSCRRARREGSAQRRARGGELERRLVVHAATGQDEDPLSPAPSGPHLRTLRHPPASGRAAPQGAAGNSAASRSGGASTRTSATSDVAATDGLVAPLVRGERRRAEVDDRRTAPSVQGRRRSRDLIPLGEEARGDRLPSVQAGERRRRATAGRRRSSPPTARPVSDAATGLPPREGGRLQRWVLLQDCLLQRPQRRGRLDPVLLDEARLGPHGRRRARGSAGQSGTAPASAAPEALPRGGCGRAPAAHRRAPRAGRSRARRRCAARRPPTESLRAARSPRARTARPRDRRAPRLARARAPLAAAPQPGVPPLCRPASAARSASRSKRCRSSCSGAIRRM